MPSRVRAITKYSPPATARQTAEIASRYTGYCMRLAQLHTAIEPGGHRHTVHVVVDQDAAQLLEDQDEAVGHQHLLQVVALVQVRHEQPLEEVSEDHGKDKPREQRCDEIAAEDRRERKGEIGADHVEAAVREVDHAHDAEDERQSAGDQEQQQSVLQRVQALDEEGGEVHAESVARCIRKN